ncbi:MAG: NF038122 family metalloprotease [Terriglobales bacterium]
MNGKFAHAAAAAAMVLACALGGAISARADGLVIVPTFDSNFTTAEQAAVNNAISFYENAFSNNMTVDINFDLMSTTLQNENYIGYSNWYYANIPYSTFAAALASHSSGDATDVTALANLPSAPPTSDGFINVKGENLEALGLTPPPTNVNTIQLNLPATTTGGCDPTIYYCYDLETAAEHEIDEVLGLASGAGGDLYHGDALPEDLFRYNGSGQLSYYANGGAGNTGAAYFSLDGTTDLAQFDNQNDGGDWGDWQSNPLPDGVTPKVQDAFLTPCPYVASPACVGPRLNLNSPEVVALDAIGYNLQPTPEPATFWLLGGGLLLLGIAWKKRAAAR